MAATRNTVNVAIKARDDASKKFKLIGSSALSMGSMIRKAAAMAAVYFSARAVKNFVQESLAAFGRQEQAVQSLVDAYALIGQATTENVRDMQEWAGEIQKITTLGDEQVLELAAMGAAMGKLHGEMLKKGVKAAIGLSKAYKIELAGAMRLVARAAVGDTSTLTRYGIKLEEGLDAQQKFNKVLEIGARNFKLAEGETKTYVGTVTQMRNVLGDIKEEIGAALMPVFKDWAERVKQWAIDNKEQIGIWAQKAIAYMGLIKDVFVAFIDYLKIDWKSGLSFALDAATELMIGFARSMKILGQMAADKWLGGFRDSAAMIWPKAFWLAFKEKWGFDSSSRFAAPIDYRAELELIRAQTFAKIRRLMPEDLAKKADEAFAKLEARLAAIAGGPRVPSAPGEAPGGAAGGVADAIQQLVASVKRTLHPIEARFLTFAPGREFDLTQKMARNAERQTKLQEKMKDSLTALEMAWERLEGRFKVAPAIMPELAITAFS